MKNNLQQRTDGVTGLTDTIMSMAKYAPKLDDLSPEQLETIAKMVIAKNLTAELDRKVKSARIDWTKEKAVFLQAQRSENTRAVYKRGLDRLEIWAQANGLDCLSFTAKEADDYIYSLSATGRSPAAIRLDVSAASAFYSFLARRHEGILHNAFIGTRARPANRAQKKIAVPTAKEVKTIIDALPPIEAAALAVCAYRGLRIGALPTLTAMDNGKYSGVSKGKELAGGVRLPKEALKAIEAAGLSLAKPFENLNVNLTKRMLSYRVKRLVKAGKIAAPYSHHDLRHFYAKKEYAKDKDVYRVKTLLNHASIAVTERYLRSLEVIT